MVMLPLDLTEKTPEELYAFMSKLYVYGSQHQFRGEAAQHARTYSKDETRRVKAELKRRKLPMKEEKFLDERGKQ